MLLTYENGILLVRFGVRKGFGEIRFEIDPMERENFMCVKMRLFMNFRISDKWLSILPCF